MKHQKEPKGLTRKELVADTNCPPYLVAYYTQCGYLPILKASIGPGDPVLYDPSAVEVIRLRVVEASIRFFDVGSTPFMGETLNLVWEIWGR